MSRDNHDKSWMNCLRWTDEYIHGVNNFLDKAFERASQGKEILCPCKKCINRYWHYRNVVEDHLVVDGFVDGYTKWTFHGEGSSARNTPHPINDDEGHPIGRENRKDCTFLMDSELRHEAHRYALFNTGDEPVENLIELDEGDFRWSREEVAVDVVDIPCNAQHSEDTIVETSEEEDDVDETDWDWMEADE
uniref:Retrotransposon protein, Ty3-gypsy subclass n=1 Tax=Solanum tuberosum TaxID=4113 RepID=M1DTK7_SOLTU